jgi:DNA replication protein DnaC
VISARHKKKSTVITTIFPLHNGRTSFEGTTAATAIADRLVFKSEILILEGQAIERGLKRAS